MSRKTGKMSRKLLAILTICALITLMLPGYALGDELDDPTTPVEGEVVGETEEEEEAADETEEEVVDEAEDNPSEWAVPEIELAIENGLVTEKVLSNYQDDITREDFCELVVKLYEALSGEEAQLPEVNVFTDTENEEILKANALGIVFGVSETEFAPDANITREAIAVMFYRTLEAVNPSLVDESYEVTFEDADEINEWALEAIGFMSNNEIIGGVGENMVAPQGNATREQAIALVIRTFEKFKDVPVDEVEEEEVVEDEEEEVVEDEEEGEVEGGAEDEAEDEEVVEDEDEEEDEE